MTPSDHDNEDPGGVDVAEEYRYLNERFYARSAATYFEQPVNAVLVIAGADPGLGATSSRSDIYTGP